MRCLGTKLDCGLPKRTRRQQFDPTFAIWGRNEAACVQKAEKKATGKKFLYANQRMSVLRKKNAFEKNTHQSTVGLIELTEFLYECFGKPK